MPTHGFKIHFLIYRSRSLQPMKHCVIHLLEEVYMFSTHDIIKSLIIIGSTWSRWDDRKFCCRHEYFRLKKLLNGGPKAWLLHPLPTRPVSVSQHYLPLLQLTSHYLFSLLSAPLPSFPSFQSSTVVISFPFLYLHPPPFPLPLNHSPSGFHHQTVQLSILTTFSVADV